jgi:hypothetical protein
MSGICEASCGLVWCVFQVKDRYERPFFGRDVVHFA